MILALGVGSIAWLLAQLVSDRTLWTQYLCWIPAELWLLGAVLGALIALPLLPRRRWWVLLLLVLIPALHVGVVRWRVLNALDRPAAGATPGAIRVLHWNVNDIWRTEDIAGPVLREDPELLALVNLYGEPDWRSIIRRYGGLDEATQSYTKPIYLVWESGFLVLSRFPMKRHASAWLGIPPAPPELDEAGNPKRRFSDPGRAMYVELDATATLGRTLVVWIVDLPSDVKLSRSRITREAIDAIRAWRGTETIRDERDVRSTRQTGPGFPPADLIVGDFNIPRGSASLRTLVGAMDNAFDQSGLGYAATFSAARPQKPYGPLGLWAHHVGLPLVHIDQMFVGAGLRAARYEVVDPGAGFHLYQKAEIVPARSGSVRRP